MPRHKYGAKPQNFPGRLNDRRIAALRRIESQIATGVKHNHGSTIRLTSDDLSRLHREGNALAMRIIPADQARAIRTKKDRRGQGKLARPTA